MELTSFHEELDRRMKTAEFRSYYEAYSARLERGERLTRWMKHILPPFGDLARVFWYLVLTEDNWAGVMDGMQFSYLNDGYRPSLWGTYMDVIDHPEYSGIWPGGAPRSKQEADAILARSQLIESLRFGDKS